MRLTCPSCGAENTLDAAIGHDAAVESVRLALGFPAPLGPAILKYLALFRPGKRRLDWGRVARLLAELLPPIQQARVERNGIVLAAPVELWLGAIESMLAKRDALTLPLKSHGYLFEVVAGMAGTVVARAEKHQDEQRAMRSGTGAIGARVEAEKAVRAEMPAKVAEQLAQFTSKATRVSTGK